MGSCDHSFAGKANAYVFAFLALWPFITLKQQQQQHQNCRFSRAAAASGFLKWSLMVICGTAWPRPAYLTGQKRVTAHCLAVNCFITSLLLSFSSAACFLIIYGSIVSCR